VYKNLILASLALLLCACSVKQEQIESSYPIRLIVKSPNIKISGLGFYKKGGDYVNLQVFSGGSASLNYESAKSICVNDKCTTRDIFNKNFFLLAHYEALIDDILAFQPIYNSKNLIKNDSGFSQSIKTAEYDISYEVNAHGVGFEDTKNGIFIKLTKLEKLQ